MRARSRVHDRYAFEESDSQAFSPLAAPYVHITYYRNTGCKHRNTMLSFVAPSACPPARLPACPFARLPMPQCRACSTIVTKSCPHVGLNLGLLSCECTPRYGRQ